MTTSPSATREPSITAVAVDDADGSAAEVDLVLAVDPGQLCRLATEDRAPGCATHVRRTLDQLRDLLDVDRVGGDVVEEEQRLGAGREDVVDAMSREVGAAPAQPAGAAAEHELRSDRVRRGGQQAAVVDREEPGERAERACDSRGRRSTATAARSRSTIASAVASDTPAAA